MATLSIPNTFVNATAAVATEVNANFVAVKTFVELLAAGTNIDDNSIAYTKLSTNLQSLLLRADDDQIVLGSQVFA